MEITPLCWHLDGHISSQNLLKSCDGIGSFEIWCKLPSICKSLVLQMYICCDCDPWQGDMQAMWLIYWRRLDLKSISKVMCELHHIGYYDFDALDLHRVLVSEPLHRLCDTRNIVLGHSLRNTIFGSLPTMLPGI